MDSKNSEVMPCGYLDWIDFFFINYDFALDFHVFRVLDPTCEDYF